MGKELPARVTFGSSTSDGKAQLETSELLFRGEFRLRIPFRDIQRLDAYAGHLLLHWPGGEADFDLGRHAAAWAEKIRNPRGLIDKLGVKAGASVAVIGVDEDAFRAQLRERGAGLRDAAAADFLDWVFYEADEPADLARLPELRLRLKDNGGIWVVSPKGKAARIKDVDVIEAARAAGLVDTKVVAFSDTHTALKLVIPVAMREKRTR
jgi:hypothetical protein